VIRGLRWGSLPLVLVVVVAASCAVGRADPDEPAVGPGPTAAPAATARPGPEEVATPVDPTAKVLAVAAPAKPPPLRRLTIAAAGDLLVHRAVWESAAAHAGGAGYDFTPMLAPVAGVIAGADLGICHLETPLSADNTDIATYPVFNAPYQLADAVAAAGFDGCSVASNHTLDRGEAGIDATLGHLDRVGVRHAGAARSPDEAAAITEHDVGGVRVAHLSYTYGFNGFRLPPDRPWRSNLIDPARILAEASAARADGADIVLVSLHWGSEYQRMPSTHQVEVAGVIGGSPDIDLVIGHHAHVVQPVDVVDGTWVLFGLGNLLSNMLGIDRQDGVIARATFVERRGGGFDVEGVTYLPTRVETAGHRVVPAPPDSWARTADAMGALGAPVAAMEGPHAG
jgi:hypothetical protein